MKWHSYEWYWALRVNIGLDYGLVTSSNKPLPELTLTKISVAVLRKQGVYTFWPSDAIWWHRSRSTLPQVMACCLTAPSHHLNQYWLIIKGILLHAPECNFTGSEEFNMLHELENHTSKTFATSPRGQWVDDIIATLHSPLDQVIFVMFIMKFHCIDLLFVLSLSVQKENNSNLTCFHILFLNIMFFVEIFLYWFCAFFLV